MRKYYSIMIKPASSLCNMRCKYCFYHDIASLREVRSYGVMEYNLIDDFLNRIHDELSDYDSLNIAFQGGEPSIAGLEWFKHFVAEINKWTKKIKVSYAFQTNGLLIDEKWAEFFRDNHFLLGISFDMLKDIHDDIRIDNEDKGTYLKVKNTMDLLKKYGVEFNVLCTLSNTLARYPKKVYQKLKEYDIRYVQFTPCLDELDSKKRSVFAITPKRFGSFYKEIFDLWYQDFMNGNYYSIKLIDDLVNLLAFRELTACGMMGKCQPQIVVEANGDVYPCDFYCLDEYKIGNIANVSLEGLYQASATHFSKKPKALPSHCDKCVYQSMCYGNCVRMRSGICLDMQDNECGFEEFLKYTYERLRLIALRERSYRMK